MEPPAAKRARVHFGSFAEQEKERLAAGEEGSKQNGVSSAVLAGIQAGNINVKKGRCALFGD